MCAMDSAQGYVEPQSLRDKSEASEGSTVVPGERVPLAPLRTNFEEEKRRPPVEGMKYNNDPTLPTMQSSTTNRMSLGSIMNSPNEKTKAEDQEAAKTLVNLSKDSRDGALSHHTTPKMSPYNSPGTEQIARQLFSGETASSNSSQGSFCRQPELHSRSSSYSSQLSALHVDPIAPLLESTSRSFKRVCLSPGANRVPAFNGPHGWPLHESLPQVLEPPVPSTFETYDLQFPCSRSARHNSASTSHTHRSSTAISPTTIPTFSRILPPPYDPTATISRAIYRRNSSRDFFDEYHQPLSKLSIESFTMVSKLTSGPTAPVTPPDTPHEPKEGQASEHQEANGGKDVVATRYNPGWKCTFEENCELHKDNRTDPPRLIPPRKVVSHYFGRNKQETKKIPANAWIYTCRKHYQRQRYRCKASGDWEKTKLSLIKQQAEAIIDEYGAKTEWKIKWVSSSEKKMQAARAEQHKNEKKNGKSKVLSPPTEEDHANASTASQSKKRKRTSTETVENTPKRMKTRATAEDEDGPEPETAGPEPETAGPDQKDDRPVQDDEVAAALQLDRLMGLNKTNADVLEFLATAEQLMVDEELDRLLPFELLPTQVEDSE